MPINEIHKSSCVSSNGPMLTPSPKSVTRHPNLTFVLLGLDAILKLDRIHLFNLFIKFYYKNTNRWKYFVYHPPVISTYDIILRLVCNYFLSSVLMLKQVLEYKMNFTQVGKLTGNKLSIHITTHQSLWSQCWPLDVS